jgi:predicted amidophosphoribosyltransferase
VRPIDLIAAVAPPVCVDCHAWAGRGEPLCARCRRGLRWLGTTPDGAVWAPVAYAGPARSVVAALKFRGAARVTGAMAAAVCANAPAGWLDGAVLVPVPLHPARLRRRGFNQADRLARAIARRTGSRVWDGLERSGPRGTQMGRGRAERLAGIAGTIRVRAAPPAAPLVVVDDVTTTGATLAACGAALRAAGAAPPIRAVAYARTPGR